MVSAPSRKGVRSGPEPNTVWFGSVRIGSGSKRFGLGGSCSVRSVLARLNASAILAPMPTDSDSRRGRLCHFWARFRRLILAPAPPQTQWRGPCFVPARSPPAPERRAWVRTAGSQAPPSSSALNALSSSSCTAAASAATTARSAGTLRWWPILCQSRASP